MKTQLTRNQFIGVLFATLVAFIGSYSLFGGVASYLMQRMAPEAMRYGAHAYGGGDYNV